RQSSLTTGVLVKSAFAHDGPVLQVAYAPDGKTVYSAGNDSHLKAWDIESMTERFVFETQSDWVQALALSADGQRLAVGRFDASSAVYLAADGQRVWPQDETQLAQAAKAPVPGMGKLNVDAVIINATIPPSIGSIDPVRYHRGTEFEITLEGKNLADAQPFFTDGAIKVELLSSEALPLPEFQYNAARLDAQIFDYAQPYRLKLKVALPADAPLGQKFLMCRTPLGLTNATALNVLPQADTGEVEPNDAGAELPALALPATIVGALNPGADVDRFRVHVEAGQELVFAITDSANNTVLRLKDAQGQVIARSEDFGTLGNPRLGYRFAQAGDYFIEFSDPNLRAGAGYRLHAGLFPFVDRVEPLGVPAGTPQKVRVHGFNIGGVAELEVDPPDTAAPGQTMPLPVPAVEGNPVATPVLAVGQFAENTEAEPNEAPENAQPLSFPGTVNGLVEHRDGGADQDLYKFTAKAGEVTVIEIDAADLGSPLDSVIEILDPAGNVLQRAQARCVAQTTLTLSDRDSKSGGLRIDDWSDFKVNDYLMVGSEIVKATRLPGYADEDISVASYPFPQRKGFFGTTPEYHAVGAPVYKVEIQPVGVQFPPNGMPVFPIFWRNDDFFEEGKPRGDSRIDFEAPADGEYVVRVMSADGAGGPRHQYRLTLRALQPDFDVVVDPYWMNVHRGVSEPVTVRVRRRDGFDEPVQVRLHDLPAGFSAAEDVIQPGEDEVILALQAAAEAASTPTDATFRMTATALLGGAEVAREARMGAITVSEKQPDLVVLADKLELKLRAGEMTNLAVKLARNNGFTSRVPISLLNLPFGVRVLNTGLNGILVREGEVDRAMEIFAEPWVKPMKHTLYIQARIETTPPGRLLFISQPVVLDLTPPATLAAATP
ncbi:MAG: pre-peptidase C-terminal domain-containing protein, partial [Candidatus Hydrogenedentes bacterium]|nr:pre-peptidase C-terminal domain-containing protein [Candidatus Hydrogenedentota bacterium]